MLDIRSCATLDSCRCLARHQCAVAAAPRLRSSRPTFSLPCSALDWTSSPVVSERWRGTLCSSKRGERPSRSIRRLNDGDGCHLNVRSVCSPTASQGEFPPSQQQAVDTCCCQRSKQTEAQNCGRCEKQWCASRQQIRLEPSATVRWGEVKLRLTSHIVTLSIRPLAHQRWQAVAKTYIRHTFVNYAACLRTIL